LLELAAPPPIDPVPYGGAAAARRALALDDPVFKVGWRGQDLKREVACTILEIEPDGRLLAFRCPGGAGEGRSGSALLVRSRATLGKPQRCSRAKGRTPSPRSGWP
jgi:hypothetical protein